MKKLLEQLPRSNSDILLDAEYHEWMLYSEQPYTPENESTQK